MTKIPNDQITKEPTKVAYQADFIAFERNVVRIQRTAQI